VRKKFLPFCLPAIGEEEISEVLDTLRSGWITMGPKTKRFEEAFAKYFRVKEAVALSSGTAALHTALETLGVGKGDSVISTPMTFCATINAIEHTGAQPILADIEPDTLNIDPNKIEGILKSLGKSQKIKAVIPVHYAGHPCEMDPILELARRYRLKVLEDAAHALPAKYKGRFIGTIGDLAAFSFYATKNLTTAEGGMLIGEPNMLKKARMIGFHGIDQDAWNRYASEGSWYYEVVLPGFKYNMTDLQAAIGLQQLKKLSIFHKRRQQIAQKYNEVFSKNEQLQIPKERSNVSHAWHLYVLRLNLDQLTIGRSQFIEELKQQNIGTNVHYTPIHQHPYFRQKLGRGIDKFPIVDHEYKRILSLPIYPSMSDEDVSDVITAVLDIAKRYRK